MKKITFTIILTLISLFTLKVFAQTTQDLPDKILGVYWSPNKDAKIEIFKNGNHYFGKTIWTAVSRKDTQNPDQRLRKRDLLGINLLTDFSYDDGVYVDGQIYDPESGKTYNCKISFSGRNLKVRGYIGISLLGRTETFERVL